MIFNVAFDKCLARNFCSAFGQSISLDIPMTRILVSKIYNAMMRALFGTKERDLDCAFRLVNKRVIKNISLKCRTGLATTEILAKARIHGFKIKEIGVNHFPRKFGQPVFESGFLNLPKPRVVIELLKEIRMLRKEIKSEK